MIIRESNVINEKISYEVIKHGNKFCVKMIYRHNSYHSYCICAILFASEPVNLFNYTT